MDSSVFQSGWPVIAILFQLLIAMAFVGGYFCFLRRSAQEAVLLAFPIRLLPKSDTPPGVSKMESAGNVVEKLDGRVNLEMFSTSQIEPSPVVRGDLWVRGGKRFADIVLSLMLIFFTLPLILVVAVAIKMTSPGPIFYRQIRVGLDGEHFEIYKFRSMRVDAEENGVQWAGANDSRITPVGAVIRKMRIDEIPQALNILMGQMSFVGPRPERPQFTEILAEQIPHYNERHRVKPGLTGWAQVNYPYGASVQDAYEKLRYDLYYLKNHSLLLDIFIILRTVLVALTGAGSR